MTLLVNCLCGQLCENRADGPKDDNRYIVVAGIYLGGMPKFSHSILRLLCNRLSFVKCPKKLSCPRYSGGPLFAQTRSSAYINFCFSYNAWRKLWIPIRRTVGPLGTADTWTNNDYAQIDTGARFSSTQCSTCIIPIAGAIKAIQCMHCRMYNPRAYKKMKWTTG